jgi:hypothetical protein
MTFPYSGDPEGQSVVLLVRAAFQAPDIFASSNRHLVFVCGGDAAQVNLRSQFLAFAREKLPHLRIILAEEAYRDLLGSSRPGFVNLTTFEHLVADLSDCVVVFPESFGSVAELGFFVGKEKIAKKLLTANPIRFQADESFVNLGPLSVVNSESDFRPNILLKDVAPPDFGDIAKRLQRYASVRRRMSFSHKIYAAYSPLEKLFILFELVRHLRIVHVATLPHVVQGVFGQLPNKDEFRHLVSVLVAAKYVERAGADHRMLVATNTVPFLEIPASEEVLVAANKYLLTSHAALYSDVFAAVE